MGTQKRGKVTGSRLLSYDIKTCIPTLDLPEQICAQNKHLLNYTLVRNAPLPVPKKTIDETNDFEFLNLENQDN